MEDKLEEIFSLQKGLTEMMNLDRYPDDTEGRISALCTAMIHEQWSCNVLQTGSGGKNLWSSIKRKLGKSWQTFGIF